MKQNNYMNILKIILVFNLSFHFLYGMNVDSKSASKLASDAYLEKQEFANIYKTAFNTVITAKIDGVRYYVIEDKVNTVVVIRGTANMRNVITDAMAKETSFLDNDTILVHQGFYDVSKKIFKNIKFDTKKKVIIIGHSLGGAVALLYGAMLKEKGLDVTLYTFGMPPVVNQNFLQKYKDLKHYRYYHIFDPVPTLSKPTIQLFEMQKKFKAFINQKDTITNIISTIENIPDKYRHQGIAIAIKNQLSVTKEKLKNSLFFKTCTLYFDYHKIKNYMKAVSSLDKKYIKVSKNDLVYQPKRNTTKTKYIKVIPSILQGTTPLEVEFYVDSAGVDIELYYFNFAGKEVLLKELVNNKISYTFTQSGKQLVKIALKDSKNNMVETSFEIKTRKPTFQEYQEAMGKEFIEFKKNY